MVKDLRYDLMDLENRYGNICITIGEIDGEVVAFLTDGELLCYENIQKLARDGLVNFLSKHNESSINFYNWRMMNQIEYAMRIEGREAVKEKDKHIGMVYLFKLYSDKPAYKIGRCKVGNVIKRAKAVMTYTPRDVEIVNSWRVENYSDVEIDLHIEYESKNIRREWFALDDDDIRAINRKMSNLEINDD